MLDERAALRGTLHTITLIAQSHFTKAQGPPFRHPEPTEPQDHLQARSSEWRPPCNEGKDGMDDIASCLHSLADDNAAMRSAIGVVGERSRLFVTSSSHQHHPFNF